MCAYHQSSDNAGDPNFPKNLIINYLPQSLTDDEFQRLFERIGPVTNAKIVRNRLTQFSYGFGFIEYQTAEDAVRAIEELNGLQLENKRIKVAYSKPKSEGDARAKVFAKNVAGVDLESLNQIFAQYGEIIQCKITSNPNIAFIMFEKREHAELAVQSLQGTLMPGASQPLQINIAANNPRQQNGTRFHNNNFQANPNMRQYDNYGDNYGGDRQANSRPRYQQSGSSYGSTGSTYDSYGTRGGQYGQQAADAYGGPMRNNYQYGARSHSNRYNPIGQQADSSSYSQYGAGQYRTNLQGNYPHSSTSSGHSSNYAGQGRGYNQNYQQSDGYQSGGYQQNNYQGTRRNQVPGHTLFVYNVSQNTDDDLNRLFSQYGSVADSKVIPNKGFGFVTMENYDDACKAIGGLNETIVKGQKIQVSFKRSAV